MMRVVVTGGGTGGHVYPALAIARALKEDNPENEVLYLGTPRGLEADVVPRAGIPFKAIESRGLLGMGPRAVLRGVLAAGKGLGQALQILRGFRPDVVVGTGGYVSGPVVLAGYLLGVPVVLQEQNVLPGMTNRLMARVARYVLIPHEEAARHFPRRARVRVTGNPVRKEILTASRDEARSRLGLAEDELFLVVFGGSGGAESIAQAVLSALPRLARWEGLRVLFVTGKRYYQEARRRLEEAGIAEEIVGKIQIEPYVYDIEWAYAAADLVISRAGALSLAEITARGLPAIIIPSPNVANNHQEYNARVLDQAGAAVVIRDADLDGEVLLDVLKDLVADPERRRVMARRSRELGRPDALRDIVAIIEGAAASGQ